MSFRTNAAPYQRTKKSTLQIMLILVAALAIVWIFGIAYSFKLDGQAGTHYGLKSILMMLVASVTTATCDVLTTIVKHKKGKGSLGKEIADDLVHNYSYVTSVIFTLTLPVYVSYYVVIIGAIFATVVVKNFFGGFGRNIFNPAIMARIFVGLCFVSQFNVPEALKAAGAGIDAISGATLTTAYNSQTAWLATSTIVDGATVKGAIFSNYTLLDLLFGRYVGALGETFTIVIFVLGIILSVLKVINWRTPVFYLGTVAVTSFAIALLLGFSHPLNYVLYHLSLGGLMFGAVFMLTDPVTGPTAPFGKSLIGVVAGLLTVLIRVKGGYPEGVMYSIAICNLLSPAIDYFTVGKTTANPIKKYGFVFGTLLVSVVLCSAVAFKVNGGREIYGYGDLDASQERLIHEYVTIDDDLHFELAEDYEAKTNKLSEHKIDDNNTLNKVYLIKDRKGNQKGIAYIIKDSYEIIQETEEGDYPASVTSKMMVAFDMDGNIMNANIIQRANTARFGLENNINEYASSFTGSKETYQARVADSEDVVGGATYSTKFVQQLLADAYAEFEAYKGGN